MKIKRLLLSFILLLSICVPDFHVQAASNDLHKIEMYITVNQDGSANIKESWNITVEEGTEVYKQVNNMEGSSIHSLTVTEGETTFEALSDWDVDASREEKKYKSGIIQNGDNYELCFGVGDYGEHTYTMQYTIDNFIFQYSDMYGMNSRLVNEDMNVKPDEVYVRVDSPLFTADTKVYAFGFEGDIHVLQENDSYYIEAKSEGRVNYVNILSGFEGAEFTGGNTTYNSRTFADMVDEATEDSDYYENNNNNNTFSWFWIVLLLIAAAFLLVIIAIVASTATKSSTGGKVPKMGEVDYFRDIPCNKNLFLFYFMAKRARLADQKTLQSGILAGILLRWIKDGYVTFVKEQKRVLFSKKDTFQIHFNREPMTDNYLERKLYDYFRQASGTNLILEDREFEKWCKRNYSKMEHWFEDIDSEMQRELKQLGYVQYVPVTKKMLFVFNYKTTETRYTPAYEEEMAHVIGFKKFLMEFGSLNEKQVPEVVLWEEYLIFASILGIADKVEKQIGRLYPEFNEYSDIDIFYTTLATRAFVGRGIHSMHNASQAAAARSDGGGGFSSLSGGGGSFSGGGGGGVR